MLYHEPGFSSFSGYRGFLVKLALRMPHQHLPIRAEHCQAEVIDVQQLTLDKGRYPIVPIVPIVP